MSYPTHAALAGAKAPPSELLRALLVVVGGLAVFGTSFEFRSAARLHPFPGQTVPLASVPKAQPPLLGAAASLAGLVTVIVWLVWQHRSHQILHQLRIPGLRFTPGWAVGWWFVPFANFVVPYRVNAELWRATRPRGSASWQSTAVDPILPTWWGLYLARNITAIVAAVETVSAVRRFGSDVWERLSVIQTAREITAVGLVFSVVAAIAAAVVVSRVDRRLRHLMADPPEPPRPDLLTVGPS